jgi:transcriptional regulator
VGSKSIMMVPSWARHSGIALRSQITIPIPERNRQILQLRKEGKSQTEVARRFKLSPSRIYLIEKQDAADRSLAERRVKLREEIRAVADLDRM